VASVSAPVHDPARDTVAAVSVSGPIERTTRAPGRLYADAVLEAAAAVGQALARQMSGG
jgi:DNA-binding IclR family transcriptional regulator